ncbi:unnamed protein product [Clonostachys rosea]|uniref:Carrier domain-containing protein n=1 Tax=Bionectria ochroleuca TaxID=29856 RepID=A0ABY6U117_BIOOC|nr:unnamed protein product [Clonostachys rosea]
MGDLQVLTPSHPLTVDPHTHGLNTKRTAQAKSTPLYDTRTVPELMSKRARDHPDTPILGYPSSGTEYVEYNFGQLEQFSGAAASEFANSLPVRTSSSEKAKVVALLGPSNLDYIIAVLALSKLGFTILFLSPRLAISAYEHLLEKTDCQHIVVDKSLSKITDELIERDPKITAVGFVPQSQYEQQGSWTPPALELNEETNQTAWIIHSSGSTGPPKPIYQTHHAALRNCENNMNMQGFITLPLYHGHGVSSVFRSITSIKKIYLMNATLPLTSPTLVQIMSTHKFDIFYGVPYALKLLAESENGIKVLAEMKVVMFGGSACPDALGDLLVNNGVNLISHYGCTETGQLMTSFRPAGDKHWNYVRVHEKLRPHVTFEQQGDSKLFELVVGPGWPSKVDMNRDDGSYATKDLFIPHPTIENAWKYISRRDDTIILLNGEKMIPIAMEQAVRQHPLVRDAIIFGTGQAQVGLLVFASENASDMAHEALINTIWPTIVEQNNQLPNYAHLDRGMISVLPPGTEFPRTEKGTIIRQAVYQTFQAVIKGTYENFENQNGGSLILALPEMKSYLRGKMRDLFKLEEIVLTDDVDLFALGVDSLQSTLLRTAILKDVDFNGNSVPQNIVFEFPSISRLANALVSIRENKELDQEDVSEQMKSLVEKYAQWPPHVPQPIMTQTSAVVVTGATGSLGAHLVACLAKNLSVDTVYCLVRAESDKVAMHRVVQSMRRRRVYHTLSREERLRLCYCSSDLLDQRLGLSDERYQSIRASVVSVMHCAWSVNFNKHLSSFEDCIVGVHNLVSLCLSASRPKPAMFNFCSSVSTVSLMTGTIPTSVPSFDKAQALGYAQSKLVSEHLVQKAVQDTEITARVIRVGQITGDTTNGIWNESEAIPLLLSTVNTLGSLPALDETHRWLPVDIVARAFADISLSDSADIVFNLVNRNSFHWTDDLLPRLREAGLHFSQVDQQQWPKQLRESNPDPAVNPTIKLLKFFESKYGIKKTKRAPVYDTGNTEQASSPLQSVSALAPSLIEKMVNNFFHLMWTSHQKFEYNNMKLFVINGSNSSLVAKELANKLRCCVINGDSLHDAVVVSKMANGMDISPLDYSIWLSSMKLRVLECIRSTQLLGQGEEQKPIVLACPALDSQHKKFLTNVLGDGSVKTTFVKLESSEAGPSTAPDTISVPASNWDEDDVLPISTYDMNTLEIAELVLFVA